MMKLHLTGGKIFTYFITGFFVVKKNFVIKSKKNRVSLQYKIACCLFVWYPVRCYCFGAVFPTKKLVR